ncbi:DNA excision repair protein ERCC-6 [Nephila pilipes]|uniref:DNA excision repair protein ERCC-6 n=1 Tax=Nephila pilipes TaxID=299642 RepID=A0A8X6U6X0_NEPPI|nr:DNA excision repair protein ERCC-6 [Nephila pilipes]
MENGQDLDKKKSNDIESVSNLKYLNDQLQLCSDYMSEDLNESQAKSVDTCKNITSRSDSGFSATSDKSENFRFSREPIPSVPMNDQEKELLDLGVNVYYQTQLETEVFAQVDKALKAEEEQNRIAYVSKDLDFVEEDIRYVQNRLNVIEKAISMAPKDPNLLTNVAKRELASIKKEQEYRLKHMKRLEAKRKALQICISGNAEEANSMMQRISDENEVEIDEETLYHLKRVFTAKETEEERLIRMGEMTPFGTVINKKTLDKPKLKNITIPSNAITEFEKFLLDQAEEHQQNKTVSKKKSPIAKGSPSKSSDVLAIKSNDSPEFHGFTDLKAISRKKNKTFSKIKLGSKHAKGFSKTNNVNRNVLKDFKSDSSISDKEDNKLKIADDVNNYSSDDVYIPDPADLEDSEDDMDKRSRKKYRDDSNNSKPAKYSHEVAENKRGMKKLVDDGNQKSFIKRIKALEKSKWLEKQLKAIDADNGEIDSGEDDVLEFEEGYKIPSSVWNKLFQHQQTGVIWLWELHRQYSGGIIADEMGLGKTIQVIAFLIGLKYSNLMTAGDHFKGLGPVILVCPATIMHQWVKEFHTWWPYFRVAILHQSGSFVGKKEFLIHTVNKNKGILITSYTGIVQHKSILLKHEWHYVILDEGHKIRNPDAKATLVVKQFRTPHRIILSGSPIQNNLKELWSLFDFIFPGKLGTLPVFMQELAVPINFGGYANASPIQVQISYKCSTMLRETINPYVLLRTKADVKMNLNLPCKSEQVLFCKLTNDQEQLYKAYISSKEINNIFNGNLQIFVGLASLRKICNHPDIFDGGPKILKDTDESQLAEEEYYGFYKRSGKMIVVETLLRLWYKQGHRVLLFTQSKLMLQILEIFVKSKNYKYMKMDGTTSISSRQPAVTKFNSDPSIFVFLLTTRVGGLGVNLTGANKVIIYDPDWNPSTDVQARERAWRIGQSRPVTIYRLLSAGTIEEKIYHRQIFKQFMTNRVLKDPKQGRFFKSNDLYELFSYQEVDKQGTETSAIFAGTGSEIKLKKKFHKIKKNFPKKQKSDLVNNTNIPITFSEKKQEEMRMLAKKISQQLANNNYPKDSGTSLSVNETIKEQNVNGCNNTPSSENKSVEIPLNEKSGGKPFKGTVKRKLTKVEGKNIDFVVKKKMYTPPAINEEESKNQDNYILSKLFEKSGIFSAMKHDVIVESSGQDYSIVENEANRVASEAIKALKVSRRVCARAADGIPTWTGQHGGLKHRFGQKKRSIFYPTMTSPANSVKSLPKMCKDVKFSGKKNCANTEVPSSSDLLSAIRNRKANFETKENDDNDESMSSFTLSTPRSPTEHDELLVDLRNFIAFQSAVNGQATTKELLDAFKDKTPITQTAVFKALLNKLCDFSRASGEGTWYLKSEFK